MRCFARAAVVVALFLLAGVAAHADDLAPVGIRPLEFADGDRRVAFFLFYPAAPSDETKPFFLPFYEKLELLDGPPRLDPEKRRPLILFSHGRGSNALAYAWFAQYLAARGYLVAAINHDRANSFDSNIIYLSGRIWQRPRDLSKMLDFLLASREWGPSIDPARVGVAGHSQGGFTALWVGGARVNAEKFLAFQRGWKNNRQVPQYLRDQMALDPEPALDVADPRIKAAFSMAPGIVRAFGMDEAGLAAMSIPAHLTVGARDTQTPPGPNAEFAAAHIPGAKLVVLPGLVDHEIFANECDGEGRDEFPEMCIDAAGVDRAAIHAEVGAAAATFFASAFAGAH